MPNWVQGKKDEDLWKKAQLIVTKEYNLTDKDGSKYWKLVTGVYKKSGGEVVKTDEEVTRKQIQAVRIDEARDYGYKA